MVSIYEPTIESLSNKVYRRLQIQTSGVLINQLETLFLFKILDAQLAAVLEFFPIKVAVA